ncbi:uncharacterized protein N7483_012163 [Penicillium malachiteum]|uniref:uncharacterized protein n=1 Tax=Penicillium malachiteum TaxID=1324776 RepID=UPI0025497A43|nr:uncharacterized protein N7483_012163 [Penicillium malachiteum]KAJ5714982.1 hypothetical protein N7483_012163 [Penicillium malachiteum]
MQLSRTAYRAALLHLTFTPIFARAAIPTTSILSTYTPSPSARLSNILFPQCRTLEHSRTAHTMSSNTTDQKPESAESNTQEQTTKSEQLALPSGESSGANPQRLDLSSEGGSTVTLDHLGPMVVNVDGTLSRISNWEQMTEIERKNTMRVLGKRNKQRLEALKAAEAAKESS